MATVNAEALASPDDRTAIFDPATGHATTLDAYPVTPDSAEAVLEHLIRAAHDVLRHQAGFVSSNFHVSADRRQVVSYGQWLDRNSLNAISQKPEIVKLKNDIPGLAGASTSTTLDLLRVFARAAAQEGITRLVPNSGQLTLINTYAVKPERADELVAFLSLSTQETLRYVPGFVSANLHLSLDRSKLINYAQWTGEEATAAARQNPKVAEAMRQQLQIAESFTPVPFSLRSTVLPVRA